MDIETFLARSRAQARDATHLLRALALSRHDVAVNVHGYGFACYEAFLRRHYGDGRPRIVALSMNPGPYGAVQTGIPFCDTRLARALVPGFDRLIARKPAWLRSERNEVPGRKLLQWAEAELGGVAGLYGRILFPMTLPIAVLRLPRRLNVPIPALPGAARSAIDAFLRRHEPGCLRALDPRGVLLLGDYAEHVFRIVTDEDPGLASLCALRVPHPAARITDGSKLGAWSRALRSLEEGHGSSRVLTAGRVAPPSPASAAGEPFSLRGSLISSRTWQPGVGTALRRGASPPANTRPRRCASPATQPLR